MSRMHTMLVSEKVHRCSGYLSFCSAACHHHQLDRVTLIKIRSSWQHYFRLQVVPDFGKRQASDQDTCTSARLEGQVIRGGRQKLGLPSCHVWSKSQGTLPALPSFNKSRDCLESRQNLAFVFRRGHNSCRFQTLLIRVWDHLERFIISWLSLKTTEP